MALLAFRIVILPLIPALVLQMQLEKEVTDRKIGQQ